MRLRVWTVLRRARRRFLSLLPAALAQSGAACPTSPSSTSSRARPSVSIDVTQKAPAAQAHARAFRGRSVLRILPPLRPDPARRSARPEREFEQQSIGSGFILGRRRLHRHQRARRRRRRRSHGPAHRQARIQGQGDRRRQAHRRRAAQDRRDGPAEGHDRRSRQAEGRRMGGRDRQAVRPREHDDRRHRQRQGPRPAAGKPRAVHPDRRRRSIRATPAGRCSTCEARWSASTR